MARNTGTTGDAGTFLVAAELALRGWPSALTTQGTSRTDLFSQVGDSKLPVAIQVKTKGERSKDFHVRIPDPAAPNANEWVVLVSLAEGVAHDFFVVPRNVVVAIVKAHGLVFPKASRVLLGPQEFEQYRGQWDLLKEPSWVAPCCLPRWVYDRRASIDWGDHQGIPRDVSVVD